jgi:hypothetical protein
VCGFLVTWVAVVGGGVGEVGWWWGGGVVVVVVVGRSGDERGCAGVGLRVRAGVGLCARCGWGGELVLVCESAEDAGEEAAEEEEHAEEEG